MEPKFGRQKLTLMGRNVLKSWWFPWVGLLALAVIKFGGVQVLSWVAAIFICLWVLGWALGFDALNRK